MASKRKNSRAQTKKRRRSAAYVHRDKTDRVFDTLLLLAVIGLSYIVYQIVSTYRSGGEVPITTDNNVTKSAKGDGDTSNVTGGTSTLAWLFDAVITVVVLVLMGLLFRWWFFSEQSAIRHTRWNRRLKPAGGRLEKLEQTLVDSIGENWKGMSLSERFGVILKYDISALKLNWDWLVANIRSRFGPVNLDDERKKIEEKMIHSYTEIEKTLSPEGMDIDPKAFKVEEQGWWKYISSLLNPGKKV